jgi:hypothetical protein
MVFSMRRKVTPGRSRASPSLKLQADSNGGEPGLATGRGRLVGNYRHVALGERAFEPFIQDFGSDVRAVGPADCPALNPSLTEELGVAQRLEDRSAFNELRKVNITLKPVIEGYPASEVMAVLDRYDVIESPQGSPHSQEGGISE